MKAALLALAATLTAPGPYNDNWPPDRFTRDRSAITLNLLGIDAVNAACGAPPEGKERHGCSDALKHRITLRNPCLAARSDDYARDLCHELGHLNGWPGDHPL